VLWWWRSHTTQQAILYTTAARVPMKIKHILHIYILVYIHTRNTYFLHIYYIYIYTQNIYIRPLLYSHKYHYALYMVCVISICKKKAYRNIW
jgi:hypothetical protein